MSCFLDSSVSLRGWRCKIQQRFFHPSTGRFVRCDEGTCRTPLAGIGTSRMQIAGSQVSSSFKSDDAYRLTNESEMRCSKWKNHVT
jgi:hypothetical protein